MITFVKTWKNSWKDSLSLFSKDQRVLVLLVTLKAIFRSYKDLLGSFWWLFILYGVSAYFFSQFLSWIPLFLGIAIISLSFIAVRPSIERKKTSYFLSYFAHDYEAIFFLFLVPYLIVSAEVAWGYTLFFIFFMFFILDSGGSEEKYSLFKAFYRTAIMILSNAPLLTMVYGLFLLLFLAIRYGAGIPLNYLFAFAPIPLCFFNTIYIKRVHEQLNWYVEG